MINFKKLKFKNFGSFGNSYSEIDFSSNELVLVSGLNGHGKSFAFLDALTFSLFGKPFRKINIPQLLNSINKKDCVTEVEFSVGTVDYKIIRGLSPKIFEIYKNGELLDQSAKTKDYQKLLEEQILRMNYKTFTQVVILGKSSFVPFMQLTPADRRMIIENILNINIFSTMHQTAKAKYSLVKEQINDFQRKIDTIQEKIQMQERYLSKLCEQKETSETKTNKEIEEYESIISELSQEIEELNSSLLDDSDISVEIDSIHSKKLKLNSLKDQLITKAKTCVEEIDFYEENHSCPVCKQGIENEFRQENIEKNKSKSQELESAISEIKENIVSVNDQLSNLKSKRQNNQKKDKELNTKNNLITLHKNKIKKLYKELTESKNINDEIDQEKNNLLILQTQLQDVQQSLSEVQEKRDVFAECVSLLKDSGIKAKIVRQYLPLINKVINTFLTNMNFFTHFELDEEFNEIIKSRYRDEFSYMSFSEGEKMRIDLALLFAWREVAKSKNSAYCNILILDEIFDSSLDSIATEELMKNLNFLKKNGSVFVISHKLDQMSDKFDKTMFIQKKNNFSKIK